MIPLLYDSMGNRIIVAIGVASALILLLTVIKFLVKAYIENWLPK
jgi:hypothetical protein